MIIIIIVLLSLSVESSSSSLMKEGLASYDDATTTPEMK
jgi:hypothetical protein